MATTSFLKTLRTDRFLLLLILLAALLRLWRLDTDLLFHRDQGMHAIETYPIWHDGQIKLLGHSTDVEGIYHGSFYYYFLAIPYALSRGDPAITAIFQVVFELLSLPFLYLGLSRLFNKQTARLALIFYALSHLLIGYSRWLNNVGPILAFANFLLYFISLQLTKWSNRYFFIIGLLAGLISQCNAAIGYSLIPTLLILFLPKLNLKNLSFLIVGIVIPALPQIIFDLRHNFLITRSVWAFITTGEQGFILTPTPFLQATGAVLTHLSYLLTYKFLFFTVLFFFLGFIYLRQLPSGTRRLFWSFLLIPILAYGLFRRGAYGFFLLYTWPFFLAYFAHTLLRLPRFLGWSLVVFILTVNLIHNQALLQPSHGLTPIGTANLTTLQDRKNIVDFVYRQAQGEPFSVWLYVLPYYQDYPWEYMFLWYGQKKYGYLPEKTGSFSPGDLESSQHFFAIYEPDYDRPQRLTEWLVEVEKNFGPSKSSYLSHDLHVYQAQPLK